MDRRVGADDHVDADPRGGGVDDGDARAHVPRADAAVELGPQLRQLGAVVRAGRLPHVVQFERARPPPRPRRGREGVGEVDLPLVVVRAQARQRAAQEVRVEGVDAGVDLCDEGLLGGGVALFDDGSDTPVRGPEDPPVARGVLDAAGEDGDRVAAGLVGPDEAGEGLGRQQGHVPVGDQDRPVDAAPRPVERGEPALDGAPGPGDLVLVGDDGRGEDAEDLGGDDIALVADHRDHVVRVYADCGAQGMADHRQPRDGVDNLGELGLHTGSLAGGQDDDGGWTCHGPS